SVDRPRGRAGVEPSAVRSRTICALPDTPCLQIFVLASSRAMRCTSSIVLSRSNSHRAWGRRSVGPYRCPAIEDYLPLFSRWILPGRLLKTVTAIALSEAAAEAGADVLTADTDPRPWTRAALGCRADG